MRGDDRRVDKAEKEEAADEGTDGVIVRLGVFSLWFSRVARKAIGQRTGDIHTGTYSRKGEAHSSQAADLFADPPDPIRDALEAVHDGEQEAVGNLHQHGQPRRDNVANVRVCGGNLGRDGPGQVGRELARLVLDRVEHLLVHLAQRKKERSDSVGFS